MLFEDAGIVIGERRGGCLIEPQVGEPGVWWIGCVLGWVVGVQDPSGGEETSQGLFAGGAEVVSVLHQPYLVLGAASSRNWRLTLGALTLRHSLRYTPRYRGRVPVRYKAT